jgi:hypothetical protein
VKQVSKAGGTTIALGDLHFAIHFARKSLIGHTHIKTIATSTHWIKTSRHNHSTKRKNTRIHRLLEGEPPAEAD